MSLVDRATAISLRPQSEWPVIAAEPATVAGIFKDYVVPLAAIGPIALVLGRSIVGVSVPFLGTYRTPIVSSLVQGIFSYVMILVGVAIMSAIAGALAPNFGGRRDGVASLKLVAYAYTPAFIAGIFGLFPPLSILEFLAGLWGLYVFYLGAPALGMCTKEKSAGYTGVFVACAIVLGLVVGLVAGAVGIASGGLFGHRAGLSAAQGSAAGQAVVAGVLGSAMGGGASNTQAAQQMVNAVASAGAAADQAQKSGDPNAQTQAGINALNALVRGGKAPVTPIAHDQLKSLLPDSAAGLARASSESTTSAFAGIAGSSANATYGGTGNSTVQISVADLGNMGGLAAMANLGLQVTSDSDSGYEKNVDVGGNKVHEKWTIDGRHSDLLEIIGNRYAISVTGAGIDMDAALGALESIDVGKFQAMGAASH
jgi:type II secretory pathway pseudopilin PulG